MQFNTDGGSSFTDIELTGTATTYQHTGLSVATEHHYQVAATNNVGTGGYSSVASATTQDVPATATVPDMPAGLTATAESDTQINLEWQAPDDGGSAITGYVLQFNTDGGSSFTDIELTGTATTYQHTGLSASTEYHYQVAATNNVGASAYSSVASATTQDVPATATIPDMPTGLTATVESDTQIDLAWTAPSSDGGTAITSYLLEYSTDGGSIFMELHTSDATTRAYQHTGLTASTEYHYQVAATNNVGASAYSSVASATTQDVPATVPDMPAGLMATAQSDTQINLEWQAPDDGGSAITGYVLQFNTDGGSSFTDIELTGTATTYQHTGLSAATEHHYQVAATNNVGTGGYSSVASATTQDVPATATVPDMPAGLTATAESDTQINLEWQAPDDGGSAITGYVLQFNTDGGSSFTDIELTGTATTYQHTGLSASTEYHYQVAATNNVGASAYSSVASATTQDVPATATIPDMPTGLTATVESDTQIDLAWTAPSSDGGTAITSYLLEYSTDGGSIFMELHTSDATTRAYQHTGLTASTEYHYQVAATNNVGASAYSSVASATTQDVPATATVPDMPAGLMATAQSDTQINLEWTAPSSDGGSAITGYVLQFNTDGGSSFTDIELTGTATTYQHTGLSASTEYHYQVAATNNVGTGAYSSAVSATIRSILSVPGVEGSVRVYPNPASQEVRLTNLPAGARTYLYRLYSLAGRQVAEGSLKGGAAAMDVSGLARGQYVLVLREEDGSETLRARLAVK